MTDSDELTVQAAEVALEREKLSLERERLEHEREKLSLERDRLRADMELSTRLRGVSRSPLLTMLMAILLCGVGYGLATLTRSRQAAGPARADSQPHVIVRSMRGAEGNLVFVTPHGATNTAEGVPGPGTPLIVKSVRGDREDAGTTYYLYFK